MRRFPGSQWTTAVTEVEVDVCRLCGVSREEHGEACEDPYIPPLELAGERALELYRDAGHDWKCVCLGCQMGRTLDGRPL